MGPVAAHTTTAIKAIRNAIGLPIQCAAAQAILEKVSDQLLLLSDAAEVPVAQDVREERVSRTVAATAFGLLRALGIASPVDRIGRPVAGINASQRELFRRRTARNL